MFNTGSNRCSPSLDLFVTDRVRDPGPKDVKKRRSGWLGTRGGELHVRGTSTDMIERFFIRILVAVAVCLALVASTRGAKFVAEADVTAAETEAALRAVERTTTRLAQKLEEAQIEIESLQGEGAGDRTQQEVGSARD